MIDLYGVKKVYHLGVAVSANIRYGFPSRQIKIIAVTGTDGKTTTSNMIFTILKDSGHSCSLISTLGYITSDTITKDIPIGFHTTTPGPYVIQKFLKTAVREKREFAVIEVSSHGLDQFRVFGIHPNISIITNITPEHLDYHKTFENYVAAKAKLITSTKRDGYIILNRDDNNFSTLKSYVKGRKLFTYGLDNKSDIKATNITYTASSTTYTVLWSKFAIPVHTHLIGKFNVYNTVAAFAACLMAKINGPIMVQSISEFLPPKGRASIIQDKPFNVIIDFAHTPNGLQNILEILKSVTRNHLIVVFGSAGERDFEKRPLMGKAANIADFVVLTSEDPRSEDPEAIMNEIEQGMDHKKFTLGVNYFKISDRKKAIQFAIKKIAKDCDTVVLCGKGPEKSFAIKGIEHPWDEFKITKNILST